MFNLDLRAKPRGADVFGSVWIAESSAQPARAFSRAHFNVDNHEVRNFLFKCEAQPKH